MVILETAVFTRQVTTLLTDDEYRKLQALLANRPLSGAIIRGSGGLRKIRWGWAGRGKRGGVRVIYYWGPQRAKLLMLLMYPKTSAMTCRLSSFESCVRWWRQSSMKTELFNELIASVREGGAILRGETNASRTFVVDGPNIRRLRAQYRLSQNEFAALLGISVATLRNWEQGRRLPDGPAKVLLQVAAKHPDAVWDVVRPVRRSKR